MLEAGVFPVGRPNVTASTSVQNLNDAVTVNTDGLASIDFGLPALNGATITFERYDGTQWVATKAKMAGTSATAMSSTATAAGTYNVNMGGSRQVRARVSTAGSGAISITTTATFALRHLGVTQDVATDLNAAVVDGNLTPVGYQQITSLTAAASLTVPAGARIAAIQAESGTLRYRDDGVAPTATVGMIISANGGVNYTGSLASVQLIAVTAGAIANVSYYK